MSVDINSVPLNIIEKRIVIDGDNTIETSEVHYKGTVEDIEKETTIHEGVPRGWHLPEGCKC